VAEKKKLNKWAIPSAVAAAIGAAGLGIVEFNQTKGYGIAPIVDVDTTIMIDTVTGEVIDTVIDTVFGKDTTWYADSAKLDAAFTLGKSKIQ
jgi:hypothetical protein